MLFDSIWYALFLICVVLISFRLEDKKRQIFLLAASYLFYAAWNASLLLLILFSTLVDFWAGLAISRANSGERRIRWLALSLSCNLGLLFTFKYLGFFVTSTNPVLDFLGFPPLPVPDLLLPVGISFYTFQSMSYTIDIYRGSRVVTNNLVTFALYVSFFPQLVAGPIERATRLLPQLASSRLFDDLAARHGARLILWGVFKKTVIADRLAFYVDRVFNNPTEFAGVSFGIASYFFAFQIYCDFSAYSDIAIGSARILRVELMENFRQPYLATSIPDFWRRWHISLSTWFRDYLYIPLDGNRCSPGRRRLNILVVFLVSGLWHGANWTFLVWGALHGAMMVATELAAPVIARLSHRIPVSIMRAASTAVTFHLVVLAWIFFRAHSITDAGYICQHLFDLSGPGSLETFLRTFGLMSQAKLLRFAILIASVIALMGSDLLQSRIRVATSLDRFPRPIRWGLYLTLTLVIIAFGSTRSTPFIYFQF